MNIVDLIKEQHREFEGLMDQVARTSDDDPEGRLRSFVYTRSRLHAHGRAEERILFPRMKEDPPTRSAALEALEWHHASSDLVKEFKQVSPQSELWLPKWLVIRGIILAHIEVEEEQALELIQLNFERQELEQLGRDFQEAEENIIRQSTKAK